MSGCVLSPCLFNFYAEYITQNAQLDEAQTGIKIAGRNINNFRYENDTTFMAESEEELKSLLRRVEEESEKVGLKLNIQKMEIMASGPITSREIDGKTVETVSDFTSISALLTMPKPLTVWITINCGKFWKTWEYQTTWPASWGICTQVRKQQLELDMEQQTGSK